MSENGKPIPDFKIERFLKNFVKTDGCWKWTGAKVRGYGTFSIKNKDFRAHRISYFIHYGEIRNDMVIDHICKNKDCVNPEHLRMVTQRFNVIENSNCVTAKNKQKTHCKYGHEFNEENTKITKNGGRMCLICKKEYKKKYAQLRKQKGL